jgi:hypothetical protein
MPDDGLGVPQHEEATVVLVILLFLAHPGGECHPIFLRSRPNLPEQGYKTRFELCLELTVGLVVSIGIQETTWSEYDVCVFLHLRP